MRITVDRPSVRSGVRRLAAAALIAGLIAGLALLFIRGWRWEHILWFSGGLLLLRATYQAGRRRAWREVMAVVHRPGSDAPPR